MATANQLGTISPQAMNMIAPDIGAQQLQLQRRQQIADMLRQQSMEPMSNGQMIDGVYIAPSWSQGIAKMAQAWMANKSQDDIDTKNLGLARQLGDRFSGLFGAGTESPDAASSAALTQGSINQPSQPDASGELVNTGGIGPTNANAQRMGQILAQGNGNAPQGGGLTIPGMNPKMAMTAYMLDPSAYMGNYLKQFDTPDAVKTNNFYGLGKGEVASNMRAEAAVKGTMPVRQGQTLTRPNPVTGLMEPYFTAPDQDNGTNTNWVGGKPVVSEIQGAAGVKQNMALAGKLGTTLGTLGQGVEDGTNKPVYYLGLPPGTIDGSNPTLGRSVPTPAAPAAGTTAPIRNNNPGALMPGGKLAQYSSPDEGIAALDNNLQAYGKQGVNTLSAVISKWAPPSENNTQAYIDDVSKRLGIKPDQQIDLTNPMVRHAIGTGIMLHENGASNLFAPSQPAQASMVRPANMPGQSKYMEELGGAAAKRSSDLVTQAQDSPTRVNVLDNIIKLSQDGVQSGPTQEWKNKVKGIAADSFGIKSWKDDVSGFDEMNKFMAQNANRAWQAAGGSGTDAQLDAQIKANVRNGLFPDAVQALANWAKAGELALQAKATAAGKQQLDSPQAQTQFENNWRTALDPRVFQIKTMPPSKAAVYLDDLKKNQPQEYAKIQVSATRLKELGGL